MNIQMYGDVYRINRIELQKYANNSNLAIQLYCDNEGFEEPFAMLTVNLLNRDRLNENMAYVDTNNCPWAEDFIKEYNLGKNTGKTLASGYCIYPLYEFNLNELRKYEV